MPYKALQIDKDLALFPKQVSMLHLRDSSLIPVLQIPQPQARGFLIVIRLQNILIRDLDDLVSSGRGNDGFDVTLSRCDQKNHQVALREYISD